MYFPIFLAVMFQSTPFARRETTICQAIIRKCTVSIHSLRKKGDEAKITGLSADAVFQSTPFARRETHSFVLFFP